MSRVPLGILDLVPVSSGSTVPEALRNSIDLARRAEEFGYARYWFAEHHLNPGVAGSSPAVVLALTAAATSTIRIGAGAVQLGHRTPLSVVEEFGLIDALYPGRLDLGLGRSGGRPPTSSTPSTVSISSTEDTGGHAPNGLRIPPKFSPAHLLEAPLFKLRQQLLQQPGAKTPDYAAQIDDILALLAGTYRNAEGVEAHVVPGEHADVQVWILGSSGGESANVAGANGLRFGGNYHVAPSGVLEAVQAYRAAFKPSAELARPYLSVSADVVVAEDEATARELATGYPLWVRSIRSAEGAIPFPRPEEARRHQWTQEDRRLVADRVETQFAGSARQVADRLEQLQEATGADELLITTITHDHRDRVRSYELLAREWATR
ncbi:LLM class flavin-dependent oxidoreductase [Amycolatopsis rhizosphaerae]|uniref:LLM class flavin-dependent oxidoreductase n=1 Tax=Amycolatopsis rhizosphaerae TaxID=2053003 RepID=A0A558BTT2_9PSEU|nr:LLM class flavin-dependent oxidoreductase [Amycolatopsis rhizosphaerae]TVT39928.1 LLM class flavin-dependent oxidoreductase [Amycolatopsis rhizosphaerae]